MNSMTTEHTINEKKESKKISLCIGGGGANGFSAVPIINDILHKDVEIVAISGCSVGAIIGAYLAIFKEVDSLYHKCANFSKIEWFKLVDMNLPTKHFIKGVKAKAFLYEIFKEITFEELSTPLTIVATNITTKQPVYFRSGKIIDAIMASISIPAIFAPYKIGDEHYFDGMLSENVPISALVEYNVPIVAIDFLYNSTLNKEIPKTAMQSIIFSYAYLVTQRSREAKYNDSIFVFAPKKLGNFSMLEFYKAKKIYQLGVEELKRKEAELEEWLRGI